MDPKRKAEMIGLFKERLAAETDVTDGTARLAWLFTHLEEFLDRWIGWLSFESMSGMIQNDLHIVLSFTIDIIEEEQAVLDGCDTFKEKWRDFAASVRNIDQDTPKDIAPQLHRKFHEAQQQLYLDIKR